EFERRGPACLLALTGRRRDRGSARRAVVEPLCELGREAAWFLDPRVSECNRRRAAQQLGRAAARRRRRRIRHHRRIVVCFENLIAPTYPEENAYRFSWH